MVAIEKRTGWVWGGYQFEDLRPGDRFRYVSKRWLEYVVTGGPRMNHAKVLCVDIDDTKTVSRYTWARVVNFIRDGGRHPNY